MTTGIYQKIAGTWTLAQRPYVKLAGTWLPVNEAYRKVAGTWTKFWEFDLTPSSPPSVRLDFVGRNTSYGELYHDAAFVNVFVKLPGGTHDIDLKMIRILTTYGGTAPTTQFGGTYTREVANNWPQEQWSDFYYNSWTKDGFFPDGIITGDAILPTYSASRSSTTEYVKAWPRNATTTTVLPAGRYYFTGWSLDQDGNWSEAAPAFIDISAVGPHADIVTWDQYFFAGETGTYTTGVGEGGSNGTWTAGALTQSNTGPLHGYALYGNQIIDAVKILQFNSESKVTVNSAQVQIRRTNDTGSASANIWMGAHGNTSGGGVESTSVKTAGEFSTGVVNCGTIAKGESKWVNIPAAWIKDSGFRGLKFWHKDPGASVVAADYSLDTGINEAPKAMQIHLNVTQDYSA